MNELPLVVLTTRLPPAICGIGTYSWLLRKHWPNESRPIEFLTIDSGTSELGDRVAAFANNATQLARELDRIGSADVLVHYAGRAYHRYGFPFWLPRVLANWKRKHSDARLVLFVHELPGKLPISSRHHWLGELNKLVVRRLAALSDVLITNTAHHAETLRRVANRNDVHLVPIGSNIGAPKTTTTVARNRTEFVLFGLPFGRAQTFSLFAPYLERWRADGRLTILHIIGPPDDAVQFDAAVHHGVLPPDEISQILRSAGFALTNASEQTWSKSTTFMACAAHGCPVVIAGTRPASAPLACAVTADEVENIPDEELQSRSALLVAWYAANADWDVTAKKIAALVRRDRTAA